jgi:hypothetical protein
LLVFEAELVVAPHRRNQVEVIGEADQRQEGGGEAEHDAPGGRVEAQKKTRRAQA